MDEKTLPPHESLFPKAVINHAQSKRFARCGGVQQSRSVWTACVFSAALWDRRSLRGFTGSMRDFSFRGILAPLVPRGAMETEHGDGKNSVKTHPA
jgi:hypothetical protein